MRRSTALVLLLLTPIMGCYSWRSPESRDRLHPNSGHRAPRVRLHQQDGSVVELHWVRLRADSVVGYDRAPNTGVQPPQRIAVARAEISHYTVPRISPGKTALAVGGGILATLVVSFAIWAATCDPCFTLGSWTQGR